ncbi:MAG: TonB-dependent receptor [Gemmatimonadetes bacterium]|nr:TonB-dependent receptor [Gemmatimonadota bacterium]NNK65026.1 TonB-dependent receptor [Gemmatimonadota bacterium]
MSVRLLVALIATFLTVGPLYGQSEDPDPLAIDGLVVTATPVPLEAARLGASVTLLRGDDLRRRGLTRVVDALREVPGLAVARNGSFGAVTSVFFRGAESDHVQVLVDGVQVNQPGGAFDFASLGIDEVERIEVVRGPGSALYGSDAVAGVIQVITRRGGGSPSGTASVRAGSFGRLDGSVSLSGGTEAVSYGFTLSRLTTDGILAFNNRHEQSVLAGHVRLRLDDASRARISARTSDRTYGFPTDGSGAVVDSNQNAFGDEFSVGLEVARRLGSRADARILVTLHDVESGTDDAPDGPADTLGFFGFQSLEAMRRTSVDLRVSGEVDEAVTLTAGAEFEGQRVRSFNESLSQFGPSAGRSEFDRSNRAGYLHGLFGAGPVSIQAGLRYDDNDQFGGSATWQVGGSWSPDDVTRLRASAGTGVKEPTFFEAFATGFTVGNPELEPERSRTLEIGVERSLGHDRVQLRATLFRQDLRDLIQYTFAPPTPGGPNYFNIAEARSRGLELGVEARTGPVAWTVDWTRLDTEVVDAGFDEGPSATFVEGNPLLRRPQDQLRIGGAWRRAGRLGFDAAVRFVGERDDRDFSDFPAAAVVLDAYTTLDVGIDLRLVDAGGDRPGVTLFARGENLLDSEYQEVFGFEAPGRGLYVGGRVQVGGR